MYVNINNSEDQFKISVPVQEGSKGVYNLMKDDYILLSFCSENVIPFKIGDYTDLAGVMDDSLGGKLSKIYEIIDKVSPTYNDNNGGYDYQIKLEAYYMKWKNKIFKYTPEGHGQEASWSLTAALDVHLNVFLRNLKALGYNFRGTEFTYSIDSTVRNNAIALTYSNTNMIDALTMMAEALECEWWITENVIHFGRCEYGDAVKIELGVEAVSMSRSESKGTYATRLYVFGGEKNVPANYRPVDEQTVVNGVVQRRLMMPIDTPYLDAYPDMTEDEAKESVVIIDSIYPQRVGTLSDVSSYKSTVENEDGSTTEATYYRYKDADLNFSKEYILPNQTLGVHFESGLLNGLEFDVVFNPTGEDDHQWEIVSNENYGRLLPDELIKPQNGDKYVLFGYDTSFIDAELLPEAEALLKIEGQKYLDRMKVDDSTFTVPLFSSYVFADKIRHTYDVGQKVNLINPAYFENGRISRVIGWELNLDIPWDTPSYTIGESPKYSRIGALEDALSNLTFAGNTYVGVGSGSGIGFYIIRTNDSTPASDSNVFSALRSIATFHRKDVTDDNPYLQRFLKGADFGKFTTGMVTGSGARIDENGDGELRSLKLRDSLIVPQITFNCIDVISGDKVNTFAYGVVKSVDTDKKIVELDLLSDEIGNLHVNDICRGTFHNELGGNVTESDQLDTNGFFKYSGFSTTYFTPVEIMQNEVGSFKFRYELQPDTNVHPMVGMKFFAYGNFVEKDRQAITYETRYYTRRLKNVNTWIIDPTKNISMQDGLLNGLVIGGFEMSGYGHFSENNYFTGTQIQFTPDQEEALKGDSAYNVVLSDYNGVAILSEEGKVISPYLENLDVYTQSNDVVSGESDVVASDYRLKTRIQAFKGKEELAYTDTYGEGKYTVEVEPHGCEYVLTDGVLAITKITDTNFCYINILVTCEGITTFTMTYKITFMRNGENPAILDLENEMFNVVKDDDGNVIMGLPLTTKAHIYIGNQEIDIDSMSLSAPAGVMASVEGSKITVTSIDKSVEDAINIGVTANYTYDGSMYNKTTSINILKVKAGIDATMYDLFVTDNSIFVDDNGEHTPSKLQCYVKRTNASNVIFPTVLPDDVKIKYSIDEGIEQDYQLNQIINTSDITSSIRFNLYKSDVLIDRETVFVLANGKKGDTGIQGCSTRESEWVVGREYHNDSDLDSSQVRFVDIALVRNDNLDTGWEAYICKKTHVSSSTITYKNTDYWEQTSENVASIFLSFLLAKNAKITFLQSNELIISDSDGNPTTVLTGTLDGDKTRIAIGSINIDNSPFRVNEKGTLYATDAHIKGEVIATSGTFKGTVYASDGSFTGKVNATSGSFVNVSVSSIYSKNGTFSIDAQGNTTINNLTAKGGTFTDINVVRGNFSNISVDGIDAVNVDVTGKVNATSGSFENVTLSDITSKNGSFSIDVNGNTTINGLTANRGTFNEVSLVKAKINGSIIHHNNGEVMFTILGIDDVLGFAIGTDACALIRDNGKLYVCPVYSGLLNVDDNHAQVYGDDGSFIFSAGGCLFSFSMQTPIGSFEEWLNSF